MSNNDKLEREKPQHSFHLESLEPRLLLSADPVFTPLALALLPHFGHHAVALPQAPLTSLPALVFGGHDGLGTLFDTLTLPGRASSLQVAWPAHATHSGHGDQLLAASSMQDADAQAALVLAGQASTNHDLGSLLNAVAVHAHYQLHSGLTDHSAGVQISASQAATQVSLSTAASATVAVAPVMRAATTLYAPTMRSTAPGTTTIWTTNQTGTAISASGSLNINNPSNLTATVSNTASNGSITLGSSNDWVFAGTSAQNLTIVPTSTSHSVVVNIPAALPSYAASGLYTLQNLTVGSASLSVSDVTFSDVVNLTGNLTIYATGTVTFRGALTLNNNGSLTIIGATAVNFASSVTLNNHDGTSSSPAATVAGTAGNIYVQADSMTFGGASASFNGSGTLTLLPTTSGRGIYFASPDIASSSNVLKLDTAAIGTWGTSFSSITIGAASGGHAASSAGPVSIGGSFNNGGASVPTVGDSVTFYGSTVSVPTYPVVSGPSNTLWVNGSIHFDALTDISINNTVTSAASNGVASSVVAYSATGSVSEGSTSPIIASSLTATAYTGIALPDLQVSNLSVLNTGASGNIVVTENAAGGSLTVLQAIQSLSAAVGLIAVSTTNGNMTISSSGSGVINAGAGSIGLGCGTL